MPYRDGFGPKGQGSRTGRGRGNCVSNIPAGRSYGLRGFCRWSDDPKDLEMHRNYLKDQLSWVEEKLSKEKKAD